MTVKYSPEQRVVRTILFALAGILGLGVLLDGVANAQSLTRATRGALFLGLVIVWIAAEGYVRISGTQWRTATGAKVRVTTFGPEPRLAVLGALVLLVVTGVSSERKKGATPPGGRKAELLALSPVIERDMRTFMAATGFHNRVKATAPLSERVDAISETWPLTASFRDSVRSFSRVREQVNHGFDVSEAEIDRAIVSGQLIQKTLSALMREKKIVIDPAVTLYSDKEGRKPISGVWGLLLENTSADGTAKKSYQIFPISRTDYQVGDEVTWDWDLSRVYGEAWYRDPGGEIAHAWEQAAEFVGRPLSSVNASPR